MLTAPLLAYALGLVLCLNFGDVQTRIVQSAIHAHGLGNRYLGLGASLADIAFAVLGIVATGYISAMDEATRHVSNLFILCITVGYGIYCLFFRTHHNSRFKTSVGANETFGSAFGIGMFNYIHLFYWVIMTTVILGPQFETATSLVKGLWVAGAWAGVVTGYYLTAKRSYGKTIKQMIIAQTSLSKLLGILLLAGSAWQVIVRLD